MALKGSLEVFGLADILQLIHFQRKSGVLILEGERDRVKLFFLEGNIAGAISKRRQEDVRLGKVLLKRGILKDEDLQIALEEQRRTGKKLGSILVKKGVVDKEHIKDVLTGQITETVLQMFGWEKGTYEFTPQAIALDTVGDEEVTITLDTQYLLMEGLRILDEWSLLEGRLTLDTILVKKTEGVAGLSEEEQEILSLVDGENDLSTIIDISGKDGFVVAKVLFSLMEKGAVESKEAVPVVAVPLKEAKKPIIPYPFFYTVAIGGAIAVSVLLSFFLVFLNRDDTVKKFRASKTVENLRSKIEAYTFEHGEYPEALDVVSNTVDPWKRPYVYKNRENTFTVMSMGADGKEGTWDDIF
jgi:hypothetical protein